MILNCAPLGQGSEPKALKRSQYSRQRSEDHGSRHLRRERPDCRIRLRGGLVNDAEPN